MSRLPSSSGSVEDHSNVTVIARCRGRNANEIDRASEVVVDVTDTEVVLKHRAQKKLYKFDHTFGPEADQIDVFDTIMAPILTDFLDGTNCTVFTYGQTGTGKTYTMIGDTGETSALTESAGIIPRSLYYIFENLYTSKRDYTVSCHYVEIYNEQIRDLFDPDSSKTIRLIEDQIQKTVKVTNAIEHHISGPQAGIALLKSATAVRKVAATRMNADSSRSHAIFTIYVTTSSKNSKDPDAVQQSKIHLVDLAGSENIARSGSQKTRAKEAGSINQSLLSLGRVINALADSNTHIPYRESKLTRLLQDSLGGRMRTTLISTLSPVAEDIDETLSTIDYATRARNVRNKPQVISSVSRLSEMRLLSQTIEHLQAELSMQRKRDGVAVIDYETHERLLSQQKSQERLIQDLNRRVEAVNTLQTRLANSASELSETREKMRLCESTRDLLQRSYDDLKLSNDIVLAANTKLEEEVNAKRLELGSVQEANAYFSQNISTSVDLLHNTITKFSGAFLSAQANMQDVMKRNTEAYGDKISHTLESLNKEVDKALQDAGQCTSVSSLQDIVLQCRVDISRSYEKLDRQLLQVMETQKMEVDNQFQNIVAGIDSAIQLSTTMRNIFSSESDQGSRGLAPSPATLYQKVSENIEDIFSQILKDKQDLRKYNQCLLEEYRKFGDRLQIQVDSTRDDRFVEAFKDIKQQTYKAQESLAKDYSMSSRLASEILNTLKGVSAGIGEHPTNARFCTEVADLLKSLSAHADATVVGYSDKLIASNSDANEKLVNLQESTVTTADGVSKSLRELATTIDENLHNHGDLKPENMTPADFMDAWSDVRSTLEQHTKNIQELSDSLQQPQQVQAQGLKPENDENNQQISKRRKTQNELRSPAVSPATPRRTRPLKRISNYSASSEPNPRVP